MTGLAADCQTKLSKCDKALESATHYIEGLKSHIEKQDEIIYLQDKQLTTVQELLERRTPWYKKPEFLIPASVVTTILIGVYIDKELK